MSDVKEWVSALFKSNNIIIPSNRKEAFDKFLCDEQNSIVINAIIQNHIELMTKWKLQERIAAIMQQPIRILNGTVGKPYEAKLDFEELGWKDVTVFEFKGLQEVGLLFDERTRQITGMPTASGDLKVTFNFKIEVSLPKHH